MKNKVRTTVWLQPEMLTRMDGWLKSDNCKNRSEFVNRALRFYMGHLASEDMTDFLSRTLILTIQGTMDDQTNRLRSILFKQAVELNMMSHTIAAHYQADPINRRELRAFAVDEVKRTNGKVSFDDAIDIQRRFPNEDWDF